MKVNSQASYIIKGETKKKIKKIEIKLKLTRLTHDPRYKIGIIPNRKKA